jgi:acyl carrier protein
MSDAGTDGIEARVRAFVAENFLYAAGGATLGAEDSFIAKGLLDSTGVLELVTFLEKTFGIAVADGEMVPENLDSIAAVARYVREKRAAAS